jgi:asparagine synthase (glutamine-hydrolysing)
MYSLAIFEEAEGRVTLVNDRYNASKLFYWHDGRRLMFASEYKAFTWHKDFPRTVDPVTVADLCLHRVPVENRTLFQAARGLPPASILTFADGQLTVRSYWSPVYADPGAPALRDEDYADGMAERMALALRRRARPDTCLLITGGLDSRIVAGLYQKEASTIGLRAASLGRPDGGDVVLGQALAGALGIPHQHIPVGTGYMAQYANPAVWKGEGRNGSYASWIVAAAPYLQSSGTRYVITGLWGNFISARHYPPAFAGVHTLQDGLRVVKEFLHPYSNQTQSLMHPDVFQKYGLESAAALERLFLQPDTSSLVQRYDGFSYLFRISQHGNTEVALGAAAAPLEPYLDNDVFDYAVGVMPPDSRMRGLVNLLLVTRHLPSLANVAMDSSGRSLIDELTTRRSGLRTFIDDTRGRILRRLMPGGHRRYPRAIPHAEALREGSRDFVTAALRQTDLYDDFFDPRAVQSLFESHLAGQGNYFMILDSVLTFILWRKLFCEQTAPATPIMQESRSAMASLEE